MALSTIPLSTPTTTTTTSSQTTTKGNGSGQACAACKYQRRKCAPDCILAPYFPHDSQRQFLNAHKLFGVSNITKIIKNLDPPSKDEAMRTIIFQSDARANDPVGGCYRIIHELQQQIHYAKAELNLVLHHLAICRAQYAASSASASPDIVNGLDHLCLYGNSLTNDAAGQFLQSGGQDRYFLRSDNSHHLQDDVNSWVVQDSVESSDFKQDMDVKPFIEDHQRGNDLERRTPILPNGRR